MSLLIEDVEQLPEDVRRVLEAARDVASTAYNAYSGFLVGAAVETDDGNVFAGSFMENASYGVTICAEPAAVLAANAAGHRDIRRLAVAGGRTPGQTGQLVTPCGRCRQVIAEVRHLRGRDIEIYCTDLAMGRVLVTTIDELLPFAFAPDTHDYETASDDR